MAYLYVPLRQQKNFRGEDCVKSTVLGNTVSKIDFNKVSQIDRIERANSVLFCCLMQCIFLREHFIRARFYVYDKILNNPTIRIPIPPKIYIIGKIFRGLPSFIFK